MVTLPMEQTTRGMNAGLELAKWVAVLAMAIDHYGKIIDPSLYSETNAIGRLAFPLFAWIIGTRLSVRPEAARPYLRNFLLWALISQPFFGFASGDLLAPNIFVTLWLGVAIHMLLRDACSKMHAISWLLLLAAGAASVLVDYGPVGPFLIPLAAWISPERSRISAALLGPLGFLSNIRLMPFMIGPGAVWAMTASLVALLALRSDVAIPRLPKIAFYALYPGHLIIFALIAQM